MTSHSNAIGYLYELCAKQKVEAPKTTCLASKPGEYVLRMTAFSLQHTGIGARKNEAKTIAACKILIQLGYLQAPIPHADQPKELPSSTGSATTISETNQWYSYVLITLFRHSLFLEVALNGAMSCFIARRLK